MSDQTNLFTQENSQATPEQVSSPSASTENLFENQLKDIRNENGEQKYGSVDKALEALKHSQQYIPELKTENERLQQELNDAKAKLESTQSVKDILTSPSSEQAVPTSAGLGEEEVARLVQQQLSQREAQSIAQKNQLAVSEALQAKFGTEVEAEIQKVSQQFGLSKEKIGELSKESPNAVLQLFGEKAGNVPPSTSSVYVPPTPSAPEPLQPMKGLISGATSAQQMEAMRKIKEQVYRKYNVQE